MMSTSALDLGVYIENTNRNFAYTDDMHCSLLADDFTVQLNILFYMT